MIDSNKSKSWPIALLGGLLAIAFVVSDSWRRYERIAAVSNKKLQYALPEVDPSSETGYELGMRKLILPSVGIDGCQWIMHTQELLAAGGWRIRFTEIDNAPDGRELHWSHGFIWWQLLLAKIHSTWTGLPLAGSIEAVSPYAGTLVLIVLIAVLPWIIYRRFGSWAAAAFTISLVGVYPFFEFFLVGNPDHHSIAAAGSLICVLMLVLGGGGWVLQPEIEPKPSDSPPKETVVETGAETVVETVVKSQPKFEYAIDVGSARRYFILSASAGSVVLWSSAATAIPLLISIAMSAFVACLLFGRRNLNYPTEFSPVLWRWWGWVGGLGSFFFYLLEYFPNHLGMRLEVNHPIYALAWLGGCEILFRVMRWWVERVPPWRSWFALFSIFFAPIAIALPVILIVSYPDKYFWVADRFLWSLHRDHIAEFASVPSLIKSWPIYLTWMVLSLLPVLTLIVCRIFFWDAIGRSWKGILMLAWFSGTLLTILGILQIRWLGIAHAVLLPGIAVILGCFFSREFPQRFSMIERIFGGLLAASVLLAFPIQSIRETASTIGHEVVLSPEDFLDLYIRDLSYGIKRSNPQDEPIILSSPTVTTLMLYYGGLKGIGTFYWENMEGLKSAARIYSADSELSAVDMMYRKRVSYLVNFSSDRFGSEYVRLLRGLPKGTVIYDAIIPSMTAKLDLPTWLTPVYFQPPNELPSDAVICLQLKVGQTPAQAHVGGAIYFESKGELTNAIAELRSAIELDPQYKEAWLRLGTLLFLTQGGEEAERALDKGLSGRSLMEVTDLCGGLALRCYQASRHAEAVLLLERALSATPNHPPALDAIAMILATSPDAAVRDPARALVLAQKNASAPDQVAYFRTLALAQAASGQSAEAVVSIEHALKELATPGPGQDSEANNAIIEQNLLERLRAYQTQASSPLPSN